MTTKAATQFVLNIPTNLVPVVTECLCAAGGYTEVSEDNAKQAAIDWITSTVQNVQAAKAAVTPPPPAPITGLS